MIIKVKEYPGFYEACKLLNTVGKKYTTVFMVKDGQMFSTNGVSVICCVAPEQLVNGFYSVESLTKTKAVICGTEEVPYPDVSGVFNDKGHIGVEQSTNIGLILYHLAIQADTAVDPALLTPVINNINSLTRVTAKPGGKNLVIFEFAGNWKMAVVPVTVKK